MFFSCHMLSNPKACAASSSGVTPPLSTQPHSSAPVFCAFCALCVRVCVCICMPLVVWLQRCCGLHRRGRCGWSLSLRAAQRLAPYGLPHRTRVSRGKCKGFHHARWVPGCSITVTMLDFSRLCVVMMHGVGQSCLYLVWSWALV